MRMANPRNVFGRSVEFHCDNRLCNELRGIAANNMHPKNTVSLGAGQHLDESGGIALPQCAAIRGKRDLPDPIFGSGIL